jgi:glycosyltransferase involved in cell wall biosynthesis
MKMDPLHKMKSDPGKLNEDPPQERPLVSIIVPAYNEADILEANLDAICRYMTSLEGEYGWELIVVNDGSTDSTGQLANDFAAQRSNIIVLHHKHNFRLGQALRYGFNNCKGEYVIVLDIDLSYSTDHIGRLLEKIRETKAKIVIASPYCKGGKVSRVPRLRKALSKLANRFLSLCLTRDTFSDKLYTLTGMVRAYDGNFIRSLNLRAMDMNIHTEIVYKAMILRARIVEIPAHLSWEPLLSKSGLKRRSSMRILTAILQDILSAFMFKPFMFFILPGLLLLLPALYTLLLIIVYTFIHLNAMDPSSNILLIRFGFAIGEAFKASPHSFIVGGVSLIVAIQLISLGIISLQNKRYFEEIFYLGSNVLKNKKNLDRL